MARTRCIWKRQWFLLAASLIAATAACRPAWAQEAAGGSGVVRQRLADQLVLLMGRSLAGGQTPRPDQLTRARILLDMALDLDADAELWRLRAELARMEDDRPAHLRALRQYLQLQPQDDVAQLDLILLMLEEQQTLDQRLATLERMLKAASARQLSHAMRSRLASYAAAAAHELGDDARFYDWLKQAAAMDPTNLDAAQMVYQLALEHQVDALALGTAAVNVVRAAPAWPQARVQLARLLMSQNAYDRAAQQFQTALMLAQTGLSAEAYADWVLSLAVSGQQEQAMALLNQLEMSAATATAPSSPSAGAAQGASEPAATAPAATLPADLELLRLAILSQAGSEAAAETSWARLEQAMSQHENITPQDLKLGLAGLAAVFNLHPSRVTEWVSGQSDEIPAVRLARGWMALHQGQAVEARSWLEPLADTDSLAALGLALLAQEPQAQARNLLDVARRWPDQLAVILAAHRLRELEQPLSPAPVGLSLSRLMERYPLQLWQPAFTVSPWTAFQIKVDSTRLDYLEPVRVELTLRNLSHMPLPLDAVGGAPTQVLLSAMPMVAGQSAAAPPPMVVEMRRKLMLEPGQELKVTIRADRFGLGQLLTQNPTQSMTLNLQAILGPRTTPVGRIVPTPVGGMDAARALSAPRLPATQENVDQALAQASSDDAWTRMRALAWLMQAASQPAPPDQAISPQAQEQIATLAHQRFTQAGPFEQAWLLRFAPSDEPASQRYAPLLDAAQRSDEPLVRVVYLACHVTDPAAPALAAAVRHENQTIRTFAQALSDSFAAASASATTAPDAAETAMPPMGD
ncbi:MAG TPA: hypothetical protein VF184_08580 [Phycisphaeraceae bacterium]